MDDHENIRKAVRVFFENETSFEVCGEAVDGYDAIEKAQILKPDLVVLDLSMPRMNGLDAAQRLKQMLPNTPIVLLTSHSGAIQGYDTQSVGIDAVVPKGDMSLLLDSIYGLLQEIE